MLPALSFGLFLLTITLVIWQPRQLNIAWPAVLGAAVGLLTGIVSLTDLWFVTQIVWNATLTFVALIIISLVLDELGFFEWCALHMIRMARGSGVRLFVYTIVLGAIVSCFFANDGAALILTPIVLAQVRALKLPPVYVLPFVMACGFVADTTSIPLIISNLVNIVTADFFHISFADYASVMLLPNVFALAGSIGILYVYYRKDIPAGYDMSLTRPPAEAVKDPRLFRISWIVLGLLLLAYLFGESSGIPVCVFAGAAAAVLAALAARSRTLQTERIWKEAPWSIVIFSIGMYVVVYGLKNAGFTQWLGELVEWFAGYGLYAAALGMGFLSALLSSVMNNLPTVMIGALAIDTTQTEGALRDTLIYAHVIGCDLGPKMTPIGSLATLIWLHVLSSKGVRIGWGYYFKTGVILTLPILLFTLTGLFIRQMF